MERAHLGTLEAGPLEWHKQQKTVVYTIGKILKLRGELDKANGAIDK